MKGKSQTGGRQPQPRAPEAADRIKVDKELEGLIPALSKGELAKLEESLRAEGCRDPLVTWRGTDILLDGHNRYAICRRLGIRYKVVSRDLADREAAVRFIVENQLARRNLSAEAASYLRGRRYIGEKQAHGGKRGKAGSSDQSDHLKRTASKLAAEYKVGEATIRRDGTFARAVDAVARNCGERARQAILGRDLGLSRGAVLRLARMSAGEQKKAMAALVAEGELPRKTAANGAKKKTRIMLPREPRPLAEKLLASLGPESSSQVLQALAALLKKQTKGGQES